MKMTLKTKILLLIAALISSVFLTGCINLNVKGKTPQQHYSLSVEMPDLGTTPQNAPQKNISKKLRRSIKTKYKTHILEIYPPQIAPQFAGSIFIYRTSEINYTSDYYNTFLGFPSDQIQQNGIKYIQASKIFKYAADDVSPLKADYALKTNIKELYADYRNTKIPQAVISIQYVLINNTKDQPTIAFNKTFTESIPLTEKSSQALVDGWNQGLQKILDQLIANLSQNK
jgi:ABC-type uncharacterized transport system auxiliary subunit